MLKTALAFILVSGFASVPAFADTLVVAGGRFHLSWEEQDIPERAAMVKDKVIYAAREKGWDVVEADANCREPACLDRLLSEHDAQEAVYVMIEENVGEYAMDVYFARRESFSVEFTGAFPQALTALRDKVKEALALPKVEDPQPPSGQRHEEPTASPAPSRAEVLSPPNDVDGTKGLRPAPFWISLGVTGGALLAYVATGIAGNAKWNEVAAEPPDMRTQSDQDFLSGVQTANRVLLGVTLAGAATTGILFWLTDFQGHKEAPREDTSKVGTGLRPVLLTDGGGICLEGTF